MQRDRIRLINMHFYGHHGVDEAERRLGGRFAVDVEMVTDLTAAGRSDDLSQTVDYQAVYALLCQVESSRKYWLLEALAHDVAEAVLREFAVAEVTVRVRKQSVPLGGLIDYAEVEITRQRADLTP